MRVLNEGISRQANKADQCTGRLYAPVFCLQNRHTIRPVYKGRYGSQALLDEAALAACMAYVDLNPIRAAMAKTPETSDHTSIKLRISEAIQSNNPNTINQQPHTLYPFAGNPRNNMPEGLPFKLSDYIELVEWTGRQMRCDKRGVIDANLPPILERLHFEIDNWMYLTNHFESKMKSLVGSVSSLKTACVIFGYTRTVGKQNCEQYFP